MNMSRLRQGVLARWSRLCAFLPAAWLPVVGLAGLTVEPSFVDLGVVRASERPSIEFALRNDGQNPVRIVELVRTCVCGALAVDTFDVAAGGRTGLRLSLDPSVLPDGPFMKTFYVRTDDSRQAVLDLSVHGVVASDCRVSPSRRVHLECGARTAVFDVRHGVGRADFANCAVKDSDGRAVDGASVVLSALPDGVRVVFTPPFHGTAFRSWTLELSGGGAKSPLSLSVTAPGASVWRCAPSRVRLPRPDDARDAEIPVRLVVDEDPRGRMAAVHPGRIAIEDAPDGVRLSPGGTVTWRAVPLTLRVSSDAVRGWRARTLRLVLPDGLGSADLFVEAPTAAGDGVVSVHAGKSGSDG